MLSSTRFAVAIHALSVIASKGGNTPVCSTYIASSVDTNPVVIRRLMSELERATLVTSVAGRAGGFKLARAPETISLADVYSAVEDESMFRLHKIDPGSKCPIAAQIVEVIKGPFASAQSALTASLQATTLRDVVAAIH
jgi:Rrf2 family protein